MTATKRPTLLAWSSGKDSAWALHVLRSRPDVEVVGLLTTFNSNTDRVAMHAVRRELVSEQAAAAGLPLWSVELPWPCPNGEYERLMGDAVARAVGQGIECCAFGDLFLEDVRDYRIRTLAGTGLEPLFPIWTTAKATPTLARQMLAAGLRARLTCVDPRQIDESFVGREFDERLLTDLPATVDRCGERGEFHSFCYDGPMFARPVEFQAGIVVTRDGFCFADLIPGAAGPVA